MATTVSSAKRKRADLSQLDWTASRRVIERLYLEEDKGLPTIMKLMREKHNFDASKAQYEAQFKLWGLRKYGTKELWRYAYFKSKERKATGKDSLIWLNTKRVPEDKIKREFRRHVTLTEQYMQEPPLPECPEGLFVSTPPEMALDNLRIDNLPWVNFLGHLGSSFNPVNLELDFEEFACQLSIVRLEPPSPSAPSHGLGFDDLEDDWLADGQLLTQQERLGYPIKAKAVTPTTSTYEPFKLIQSALHGISSDSFGYKSIGQRPSGWNFQLGLFDPDTVTCLLKTFVYLSSNKLLVISLNRKEYTFFDWIAAEMPASMLAAMLSTKLSTTDACLEHIFESAVLRGDLRLAHTLLANDSTILRNKALSADNDENRSENLSWGQKHTFNALFEAAVRLDDTEIIRHFLEARDDVGRISPLWNAQSPRVVELLLGRGAIVDERRNIYFSVTRYSATAVCYATFYGNTAVVKSLIENRADVNLAVFYGDNGPGVTPLQIAIDRAVRDLKHWRESEDANEDELQLVRVLLDAGANVDTLSDSVGDDGGYIMNPFTPLQVASKSGHKSLSALLLDVGADVNMAVPNGSTPLLGAVKAGHVGLVEMLIRRGADVNTSGEDDLSCLMAAVDSGFTAIVKLLLDAGANLDCHHKDCEDCAGLCLVETAQASDNWSEILHILLSFGAQQPEEGQRRNQLVQAISRKDCSLVQSTLDSGVKLTYSHRFRSLVLIKAIESGDQNLLRHLIQSGIDINGTLNFKLSTVIWLNNAYGSRSLLLQRTEISPLGYAIVFRGLSKDARLSIISTMLDSNVDPNASLWHEQDGFQTALHFVVDLWMWRRRHNLYGRFHPNEDFEPYLIKLLLRRGASTNALVPAKSSVLNALGPVQTPLGMLALDKHGSQRYETLEIAKMLINAGADVSVGGDTFPPLLSAVCSGNLQFTKLLREHRADIGRGALALAILYSHKREAHDERLAIIYFLLDEGANVNPPPSEWSVYTPFQAAVKGEHLDLINRLIDLGADIRAPGIVEGYGTALHIAARRGSIEIAHLLIEKGAEINAPAVSSSFHGRTALEYAAGAGRLDMVQLLTNAGADTHLPGSMRYRSAENCARKAGHVAVADLLKNRFEDATWG